MAEFDDAAARVSVDPDASETRPVEAWGSDDGQPASTIVLADNLPANPAATDSDPSTADRSGAVDEPARGAGDRFADLVNVVGVRFASAGRVSSFDAGDLALERGDSVVVDSDRGPRVGTVALASSRRPMRDRLRRVMRRSTVTDRNEDNDPRGHAEALRIAKDRAKTLRLPMKVFRVEHSGGSGGEGRPLRGGRMLVYFTSDERLELRDFIRDLSHDTGARVELRQIGARDEAKMVGGLGACGLELCCTTWLPDFVPVSIKMAKDQGLVLSPTKVAGQCGRLKCCLVYEQATYAEMRKGLPKLGKRVVTDRGEGRVVEVDVMRQRVRVAFGPGESEVLAASETRPLFPSGNQAGGRGKDRGGELDADNDHDDNDAVDPTASDLPSG